MSYAKSDFHVYSFIFGTPFGADGPWYVVVGDSSKSNAPYLHSDLEIRGTAKVNGKTSGYYATEQDAWDTVDRFLEKQGVPGNEKPVIDYEDRINTLERRVHALELLIDRVGDRVSSIVRGDNG